MRVKAVGYVAFALVAAVVGFVVFMRSGASLSDAEARCYNIASTAAPTGKADKDTFMSEYRACVAGQR